MYSWDLYLDNRVATAKDEGVEGHPLATATF